MVRFKNRYLVCEIISPNTYKKALEKVEIFHWISNTVEKIHGEFGFAVVRPGLTVKYYNPQTRISIIRARHGPHNLLASALPFAMNFHQNKMQLTVLYTGASLACCYKFLQKHQRSQLDALWNKFNPSERQKLEAAILDNSLSKFLKDVG